MTANDVYKKACALMDEIDENGEVNEDTGYEGRAPELINMLQSELAFYEGTDILEEITSLDNDLEISNDTASRVMPYGLAAQFALGDRNDNMYADYSAKYHSMIRTIKAPVEEVEDSYNILDGMT
jgi:hypothetical protein